MSTPLRSYSAPLVSIPAGGGAQAVPIVGPQVFLLRWVTMLSKSTGANFGSVSVVRGATGVGIVAATLNPFTTGAGYSFEVRFLFEVGDYIEFAAADACDFTASGFLLTP